MSAKDSVPENTPDKSPESTPESTPENTNVAPLKAGTTVIEVGLKARDHLTLMFTVAGDNIVSAEWSAVGCLEFLRLVADWRKQFTGPLEAVPLPVGEGHAAVLLREAVLKAKGRWMFPYRDDEICHCRAVATKIVDEAIVGGCHTLESVRRATSASTSCGTCRPDIEKIFAYRLRG